MKVILLEDVKSVGKKGELVEVSEGYAKNFLFSKKFAKEATKSNINELELKTKSDNRKKQQELEEAIDLGEKIKAITVTLTVKTGNNGKIFGAVTNKEISLALEKQTGIKIDKKKITLKDTIKSLGNRSVTVKLHHKVSVDLEVKIVEE